MRQRSSQGLVAVGVGLKEPHFSFSLESAESVGLAALLEPEPPELAAAGVESHQVPQKDGDFLVCEPVVGVHLEALLAQVLQVVPEELVLIDDVVEVELVVQDPAQSVEVVGPVIVVLLLAEHLRQAGY